MSSAFERLQKLAEEKRLKEKLEKPVVQDGETNSQKNTDPPSAVSAGSSPSAVSAGTQPKRQLSVAPEKDFAKVANSIVRQIPSGVFLGKSKQMYDYLYSLTRGAIKPARSVRISKNNLMRGSGIRSTHTFYNNVRHLESIGLIISTRVDGEKEGNIYEVLLPDELKTDSLNLAQLAQLAQLPQLPQKLHGAVSAVSALTALGSNPIKTAVSSTPKTSFKDNVKLDDESARAFAGFIEILQIAAEEITGKKLAGNENENLKKLAELLVLELKIAVRRTNGVSSVPAFLTEVLRRKLRDVTPTDRKYFKMAKSEPDTTGKSNAEIYEIKPLDEQGREAALEQLLEFAEDEFLQDFSKWYTSDDWAWIIQKMKNRESEIYSIDEKVKE